MKRKTLTQDGLTLIELLLTLSLFFIVGTIVFNVFINGLNYSNQAQSNVTIQQEANLIITALNEWHESKSQYDIALNNTTFTSTITLIPYVNGAKVDAQKIVLSSANFDYRLCYDYNTGAETCNPPNKTINNTSTNTAVGKNKKLPVKLIIRDKTDIQRTFEIKTILSRM